MGKRSDFPRVERDFYPTPRAAVIPLLPHLKPGTLFEEPCCGNLALVEHLESFGHQCVRASDTSPLTNIDPVAAMLSTWLIDNPIATNRHSHNHLIVKDFSNRGVYGDALEIQHSRADMFITNPPWRRDILHPLIIQLTALLPTWLLIDADWMHTKQSAWYMERCRAVASIGRVKWIEGSANTGKDNCVWMLFNNEQDTTDRPTSFYGRQQ